MAERTAIEWTDATVNFWWGYTKVGPGCDHCYAETLDHRYGGEHWGIGAPRKKIKGAVALIHRLDNGYSDWAADAECSRGNAKAFGLPVPSVGNRRRVFIQSMSDLFDLEVDVAWFEEAWQHIEACDRLSIQIVTKRVSVIRKRLAAIGRATWPKHVGLIITVATQAEADRDIPRLLEPMRELDIPWIGLSVEPMLGAMSLPAEFLALGKEAWVICGGESGPHARPMHPDWARALRYQCVAAGVPFHFKQWGEWGPGSTRMTTGEPVFRAFPDFQTWVNKASTWVNGGRCFDAVGRECKNGADMMRARDESAFPVTVIHKVGKSRAGRLLDGVEWNQFPEALT